MTDQQLLTLLQYALVEPPDGGASWPSGLWTRDEVIAAFNTRTQQYLRDTQAIVTRVEIPVVAGTNPVSLPVDWIATLAAVWRTAGAIIQGSGHVLSNDGIQLSPFSFALTNGVLITGSFTFTDPQGGDFVVVADSFTTLDTSVPGQLTLTGLATCNGNPGQVFSLVATTGGVFILNAGGYLNNTQVIADGSIQIATTFTGLAGVRSPLTPSDSFEIDLALPSWETTQDTPIVLLDGDDGTLTARLGPVPSGNGTLELLYVALATPANGSGVILTIPDEALDGIRYGTLADLLSKVGRGADPMRAQYCQERFELGELVTEILLGGWA